MPKDPYKYFRIEAREIVELFGAGVLELSRGPVDAARVAELLRAAHTLKGAASIVKLGAIAARAHAIEAALLAHRDDPGGAPAGARLEELARLVREIDDEVRALSGPAPDRGAGAPEAWESVRTPLADLDALTRAAEEVRLQIVALRQRLTARDVVERRDRELVEVLDRLAGAERDQRQLITGIEELRLVPASTIFSALERAAREAATTVEKPVHVTTSGGEERLDAHVLAGMRDALVQLVRNAVVHGLEPDHERRARGKPVPGEIAIRVTREGRRVVFACRDDGRGVDLAALRRAAQARGVERAEGLSLDEVVRVGGLSTQSEVSELAGRGVGLDVVRTSVTKLRGELRISSEPGAGTTIALSVPTSLTSAMALVAIAGAHVVAIPIEAVARAVPIDADSRVTSGNGARLRVGDDTLPFSPLTELLGGPASARPNPTALVMRSGAHEVAVGVDRVIGNERVIVWPLPPLTGPCPGVAGAALDAEGSPRLVLEPRELAAMIGDGARLDPPPARRVPRVLVIDDSPTTRMLEQSILESAGYEVDLASSAEDGLAMAAKRSYALFLVDVEMPGMDGFAFVARTRADPALSATPAVLVTSRSSREDKRRGQEAGARAYVVKSEFSQDELLATLRTLTGGPT